MLAWKYLSVRVWSTVINSTMLEHDYETAGRQYPWCFRIRGSVKTYIYAREWAQKNLGSDGWASTWTSDSRDYMDDQDRDWLFVFKSRDNYLCFMLAWHDVHL